MLGINVPYRTFMPAIREQRRRYLLQTLYFVDVYGCAKRMKYVCSLYCLFAHTVCDLFNVSMCFKTTQITKVPEKLLSYAVRCKNLTVSNARTVLLTPEIYISQNVYEQLLDLLLEAVRGARKCHI